MLLVYKYFFRGLIHKKHIMLTLFGIIPHILDTLTCESTGTMRVIQFPGDLRCHRRLLLAGSGRHRYAVPLRAGNWSRLELLR